MFDQAATNDAASVADRTDLLNFRPISSHPLNAMRPYLAIIADSFREALASRLLWVLLGVITLVLFVLAPFGYREEVTTGLNEGDVRNWPEFIKRLKTDGADAQTPAGHLLELLDEKTRQQVQDFKLPDDGDLDSVMQFGRQMRDIRQGLAKTLQDERFYDRERWRRAMIESDELKQLLDQEPEQLSEREVGRRNRLLLEAAFPDQIDSSPPVSLQIRYALWDVLDPIPVRQKEFRAGLESIVSWLLKGFVGVIGLFVAVVVTAPIIPQMFEPGSLHLLLSKPISRSLLLVTKFLGGCAFTFVNAAYLILGCWIILGLRFGVWNAKLLLGIPIYLFMFAIYYAVSALTGLWWRNSIISIGVTALFWLMCLLVGLGKNSLDTLYLSKQRFVQLVPAGDELMGVNEMGLVQRWDPDERQWAEVFVTDIQRQLRPAMVLMPALPAEMKPVGPVYDATGQQLISVQRNFRNGQLTTYVGPKSDDWKSIKGVGASFGAMALVGEPDGRILCVSSLGLYRLTGDPRETPEPVKVFGFTLPLPTSNAYESVGPDPMVLIARPAAIAINQDNGELAVYSRGKMTILARGDDSRFERRLEKSIDSGEEGPIILGYGGGTLLVGRENGQLIEYDAATLEERASFTVERDHAPRFITAAPGGGRFAIVFHHGYVWTYDSASQRMSRPPVTGQGNVSCAVFSSADQILVADRRTRVTQYDATNWSVLDRKTPFLKLPEIVQTYVLNPLYVVFPKPGELDNTIEYLLSGKTTPRPRGPARQELEVARKHIHPWTPVWSSGLFVVVALLLGCVYLERQEF